jgi:hypothetical protein
MFRFIPHPRQDMPLEKMRDAGVPLSAGPCGIWRLCPKAEGASSVTERFKESCLSCKGGAMTSEWWPFLSRQLRRYSQPDRNCDIIVMGRRRPGCSVQVYLVAIEGELITPRLMLCRVSIDDESCCTWICSESCCIRTVGSSKLAITA